MQHKGRFKADKIIFYLPPLFLGAGDAQNALPAQNMQQAGLVQSTPAPLQRNRREALADFGVAKDAL